MATIAFAPSSRAFSTMRSMACRRLSSSSRVYCGTSPWRSEVSPAPNDLAKPMLRTTRPKASPRSLSMTAPGRPRPVVMGNVAAGTPAGVDSDMTASYGRSMPMRLAVCAEMMFLDLPITERVQRIAEAGFDAEIWDWTRHDIEDLAATGAVFSSMTGYVRGNFGDGADELIRTARESIAAAETLGCPRLNLHGTGLDGKGLPVVPGEEMPGPLWISAARTLTRLGELAERAGITFCLENLNTAVDHPGVPFARAADTIALVEAVGHPRGPLMPDPFPRHIRVGTLFRLCRRSGS